MKETVLYITAHPLTVEESFSLTVGKEFIDSYKINNPEANIIYLDLFKDKPPVVDADIITSRTKLFAWRRSNSDIPFQTMLSDGEKEKLAKIDSIVDQFMKADKIVFVSPMWNLTIPHALLDYLNCLLVPGKTYKYTDRGPIGLLSDKKVLHIQASGGIYSHGPAKEIEMGNRYVQTIMHFMGLTDNERLFVEGMAEMPDKASEIKHSALISAKKIAEEF